MAPRKKVASKAKPAAVKTADDVPKTLEEMPNVTVRRPIKDNVSIHQEDETNEKTSFSEHSENMNVTVVLEKMPDHVNKVNAENSASVLIEEDEESDKKVQQKKVLKKKPKSKMQTLENSEDPKVIKKTRKRAASEDRQTLDVVEKIVNKNRKRPVDKDASEPSKAISPLNELPKRNRRAASVDILACDTTSPSQLSKKKGKAAKGIIEPTDEDEAPKKSKKGAKKEEPKVLEKNTKVKKNNKKGVIEEKENNVHKLDSNDGESSDVIPEAPKSKRGAKKDQIEEDVGQELDVEDEAEKIIKPSKSRATPKIKVTDTDTEKRNKPVTKSKQNQKSPAKTEESSDKNDTDNSDGVNKTPEIKQKRVPRSKQINKSPEKTEESSDKNDTDNSGSVVKTPEIKQKRVPRSKQTNKSPEKYKETSNTDDSDIAVKTPEKIKKRVRKVKTEVESKSTDEKIPPKPAKRVGRKVKGDDFEEEATQKSPIGENEVNINTGDLPDGHPDTPESGKNVMKPPIPAKRKAKAKTAKK